MEKQEATDKPWISLFDGETTKGWHTYGKETSGSAWKVKKGLLYLDASQKEGGKIVGGGDILTDQAFEEFHLEVEWKISEGGNSGLLFYVHEDSSRYQHSWQTGPEMQLLDNQRHPDSQKNKHRNGDLYDLIPASQEATKAAGEWNQAAISSRNGQLDFYLNGMNVLSTHLWDKHWYKLIADSKFSKFPGFGSYKRGRIALQDHGDTVWFRNIRIKRL